MPWNSVRIGERKLSTARERTISSARRAADDEGAGEPRQNAQDGRQHVGEHRAVEKISRQRQNTSISEGNRKRGKNSEANCQSRITTTNGSTDDAQPPGRREQHGCRGGDAGLRRGLAHLPGAW